ncbi:MAG: BTAD domain-containing putative transcriptional regulator [Lapillicoccus sp.]
MRIGLLGALEADHGGAPLALGPPKQRALFAMLALTPGRIVSTDHLVDGIWGEQPPSQPLASIQVYVHGLRKALATGGTPAETLASRSPGYLLQVSPGSTDLERFEEAWESSRVRSRTSDLQGARRTLQGALELWRGPALADLRSFPFAEAQAARFDERRLGATEDLVDLVLACGQANEVVGQLEELTVEHPTRERLWGQLMIALYRSNRQADALATYARARDRLADELGIDPGDALRQLELGILRHAPELAAPAAAVTVATAAIATAVAAGDPAAPEPTPRLATTVRPRREGRVPRPLTATWGRDELVDRLAAIVSRTDAGVVSLIGPGGSGKTRLATLVARAAEGFGGGRYFLAAGESDDGAALLTDLALTLGGAEPEERTLEAAASAVITALPAERVLIVLDNLEVVPDAATAVSALVSGSEQLVVLATSRLPLRLSFETEVVVPPVSVPAAESPLDVAAGSPAVALFVDRALLVNGAFRLEEGNVTDVVALCRLLGGVPLAIELAASRMRLLTPAIALKRLREGLDLLAPSTLRGVATPADPGHDPARQTSLLSETIEWSLAHLPGSARDLLDDLTIFEDGFGLEAVEALASLRGPVRGATTATSDPVDDLGTLLECGLVQLQETTVELRYHVIGTVRTLLRAAHTPESTRRRARLLTHHAAWLSDRISLWGNEIDGPEGDVTLGRFADEHDDLTALISWGVEAGEVETAARLAVSTHNYWLASGRARHGADLLARVDATALPEELRAEVSLARARLAYQLGEHDRTMTLCRSVLDSAYGGPETRAGARGHLAAGLVATGRVEEGRETAVLARAEATAGGWRDLEAFCLSVLAIASAMLGDLDGEQGAYLERLEVVRRLGDRARIADTVGILAEIALDQPDVAAARDHVREALLLAGDHRPMERRDALITAARVSLAEGDDAGACADLADALDLVIATGQPQAAAQCARVAAGILGARGDHRGALRLHALAHGLSPVPAPDGMPFEADLGASLATARDGLGEAEAARLWLFVSTSRPDVRVVVAAVRAAVLD